jgi:aspartyl/glutamyl-tRNA(Asn/Gln) amidotransferase, C subunit
MSLDKATVRNIAELARIEVREEELDHLAGELSGILTFVEQLAEVNTDGVEPMSSVADLTLPVGGAGFMGQDSAPPRAWRRDEVTDGGYAEAILANAPDAVRETGGGFFTVPKMVE